MYQAPFEYQGEVIDPGQHPLQNGLPPVWASGWGQDDFGVFAVLTVEEITQKLRWIPPGRFMMGSPEGETGRLESEGPQHLVTIASGFWLFDTPVTQALWQAVMKGSPSRFEGAELPVERVSWEDAKAFIGQLKTHVPGLDLRLPSEAEWEYACRAGTNGRTYLEMTAKAETGSGEDLGQIAWYNENSERETHPVGQKKRNGFGLYDMLGNVWEWCEDEWHASYAGSPGDGSAWLGQPSGQDKEGHAFRVIRGGSWISDAQGVRSAVRGGGVPSYRNGDLGFRCAGGPVELKQAARSAQPASEIPKA